MLSSRPNTRVSTAVSVSISSGSGATPILYGYFPRRFTIRSTPRPRPYLEWEKYELLPESYRPYTGRSAVDPSEIKRCLGRLSRLTIASHAKQNHPWTKDAKVVCKYSWGNNGIATYRDTAKCVYDVNGGLKRSTQRGSYRRYWSYKVTFWETWFDDREILAYNFTVELNLCLTGELYIYCMGAVVSLIDGQLFAGYACCERKYYIVVLPRTRWCVASGIGRRRRSVVDANLNC